MGPCAIFLGVLLFAGVGSSEDTAAATSTVDVVTPSGGGAYNLPPPPPPPHGGGPPPFGGGFPGGFPGFFKNIDFNYGAGYGLPGLGGLGGLGGLLGGGPLDGEIPPPDLGGGFGGFPAFGPSYTPSTWIGSALGAKGDLLFPIVIFVFFVVGVWTVIQLLLGFIVPLIASKLAIKSALLKPGFLIKRDVGGFPAVQQPDLDFITTAVMDAINEPKCLKYVACHAGNFLNSMAGGDGKQGGPKQYEGILKALSTMTHSDSLDLFEKAFIDGSADCSKFTCDQTENSVHVANDAKNGTTTSGVAADDNSEHANEVH